MHIYKIYSRSDLSLVYFIRATYSHDAQRKVGDDAGSWEIPHSFPNWVIEKDSTLALYTPVKAKWDSTLKIHIPAIQ